MARPTISSTAAAPFATSPAAFLAPGFPAAPALAALRLTGVCLTGVERWTIVGIAAIVRVIRRTLAFETLRRCAEGILLSVTITFRGRARLIRSSGFSARVLAAASLAASSPALFASRFAAIFIASACIAACARGCLLRRQATQRIIGCGRLGLSRWLRCSARDG